jgi:hypothetical protein
VHEEDHAGGGARRAERLARVHEVAQPSGASSLVGGNEQTQGSDLGQRAQVLGREAHLTV